MDFIRPDTPTANISPNLLVVQNDPNLLQIGEIAGLALVVGVRHLVSDHRFFFTNDTGISHSSSNKCSVDEGGLLADILTDSKGALLGTLEA